MRVIPIIKLDANLNDSGSGGDKTYLLIISQDTESKLPGLGYINGGIVFASYLASLRFGTQRSSQPTMITATI